MIENIRLSFQGIWSHKMRSFLTMLGIIIGIAALIAIVSTIQGTNEQIKANVIGAGNNNVSIQLYQGEGTYYMDNGVPDGVRQLGDEQKTKILALDTVKTVSFYMSRTYYTQISRGSSSIEGANLYGIDQDYLATCGYQIFRGRGFEEEDYTSLHKAVLLDENAINILFPDEEYLGKTIEIAGEPFVVLGMIRKSDSFEPTINSYSDYYTYYQDSSPVVLIPDSCWPIVCQYDEPQNVVLMASSPDDMSAAGKAAAEILNEVITDSDNGFTYKADDLLERAKSLQQLSDSTNRQLIWIAAISLLVGGIGVMNIMLVSVTERTAEIGLKKAIGARKSTILLQFLTEAAVLTSLGGILGVACGIAMAQVISKLSGTPVAISVPSVIIAVAFSMVIGILFGLLPSVQAANLNPIEALRRD